MKIDIEKFGICVVCGNDEDGKDEIVKYVRRHNLTKDVPKNGRVRIIQNPERNLHPEEQTDYAEMFVQELKEKIDKLLLTTNSFHFLEAFLFFMEKYDIPYPVHFFTVHNSSISESPEPYGVMKNLSQPSFDLEDMKFEFEMEGRHDE